MSHYKHLSIEEREKLYLMRGQGKSFREIGRELERSASTLSREWARNRVGRHPYSPSAAQRRYVRNKQNCGRKRILSSPGPREAVRHLIEDEHWSPEQIQHRLALENNSLQLSFITIYRAIWAGIFDPKKKYLRKRERFSYHLRRKGKKKRANGTINHQGRIQNAVSISERPEEADKRTELGHWEADTVAGTRGGSLLLTLTDRKSRYLLAARVPNSDSDVVCGQMTRLLASLPPDKAKTVTPDRGHEFAAHGDVSRKLEHVSFFFADPHAPWQRGTNENTNGLLRECVPKYSDISAVPDAVLQSFIFSLNRRPRKCLNWLSPFEVFSQSLLHLT